MPAARLASVAVLLLLVAACGDAPLHYNGVQLGIEVDTLTSRHADARLVDRNSEVDEVVTEHLANMSDAEEYRRQPHAKIQERYLFRDGVLAGAMVVVEDRALLEPIVALLESENGPPHDQRSVGNSSVKMWITDSAELVVLSFDAKQSMIVLKAGEGVSNNPLWFGGFVLFHLIGIANLLTARPKFVDFLRRVRAIDSPQAIAAFQDVAKRSMYGALVQIVVLGGANLIFVAGYLTDRLDFGALLVNLALSVVLLKVSKILERDERRIRDTPTAPEHQMQVAEIIETWLKKPLPNW